MTNIWKSLILGTILTSMAACSGSGGGASGGSTSSSDLVISGKLGASSSIMSKASASDVGKFGTYDDLKFYVTVYTDPPQIKSVDLANDGSFSLSFPGASGNVIMASFKSKSTGIAHHVSFVDSSKKALSTSGDAEMDSYPLKGNVNFGTLNIVNGKATIDVVTVIPESNKGEASGDVSGYDFSGTWKAAPYAIPAAMIAEGFMTAEDPNGPPPYSCGDEPCVPTDMPLTFVKINGKEFTPGAGCTDDDCKADGTEGTIGTANKYGISIWEGPASGTGSVIEACGYKTGFTADSARFGAGIHIPSVSIGNQVMTVADFTFGSINDGSENAANSDNQPWMKPNAEAEHYVSHCFNKSVDVNGSPVHLYVCPGTVVDNGAGGTKVYWANERSSDGGCVEDGTNKPVRMMDWTLTPDDGTCIDEAVAGFPGFARRSCHYTNKDPDGPSGPATATSFTCKFGNGIYTSATLTTPATDVDYGPGGGGPDYFFEPGDRCDSLDYKNEADADLKALKKLAVYQCYAQVYERRSGNGCLREYRFNWGANHPDNFVMTNNRARPRANFLTDILSYSADGNTFFVNSTESETVGIKVSSNGGMEFCDIETTVKIVGKKMSDTQQLFTLVESGTLKSAEKTACVAAVNGEDNWENGNLNYRVKQGNRLMFLVNKQ